MTDPAHLTPDHFDPLVGQDVVLSDGRTEVVMRLESVKRHSARSQRDSVLEIDGTVLPPRAAFALTLEGPLAPVLAQGNYHLDFPGMGRMTLFVCPFRQDQTGTLYDIGFS